jgi:hypothetical protein
MITIRFSSYQIGLWPLVVDLPIRTEILVAFLRCPSLAKRSRELSSGQEDGRRKTGATEYFPISRFSDHDDTANVPVDMKDKNTFQHQGDNRWWL